MPCRSASASLPVAMSYGVAAVGPTHPVDQRGHRVRGGAVHPDLAVPVERHEPPGRVDQRVDDGQVEAGAARRSRPSSRPTRRRAGRRRSDAGLPDRVEVEHVGQVVDVGRQEVVGPSRGPGPGERHPLHASQTARIRSSLARRAIHPVASVSAGPPCGGLYLKPPSVGGLCEGVTTMPSARPRAPDRCRAAVGAQDRVRDRRGRACSGRRESTSTVTSLATSTSSAVTQAGSDRPWVSRPTNSGPSKPCSRRYSQIAWVVARMCASLNEVVQAGAAVARGAEGHLLVDVLRVRFSRVVGRHQVRRRRRGRRAGRAVRHGARSCLRSCQRCRRDHTSAVARVTANTIPIGVYLKT